MAKKVSKARKSSKVRRKLPHVAAPTMRKGVARRKTSPKEKLKRKRLAAARKARLSGSDKKFDKVRSKITHRRRTKGKGKGKKSVVAGKGRGRKHKLAEGEKPGMSTAAKVGLGVAGTVAAVVGGKKVYNAVKNHLSSKAAKATGAAASSATKKAEPVKFTGSLDRTRTGSANTQAKKSKAAVDSARENADAGMRNMHGLKLIGGRRRKSRKGRKSSRRHAMKRC